MMTRKIKPRLKRTKALFLNCCSYIGVLQCAKERTLVL